MAVSLGLSRWAGMTMPAVDHVSRLQAEFVCRKRCVRTHSDSARLKVRPIHAAAYPRIPSIQSVRVSGKT